MHAAKSGTVQYRIGFQLRFLRSFARTTSVAREVGCTHLTFRILFGNLQGPRAGPRSTLQNSPWPRNRRKYEPVVEHHVEDAMHILESIDFVLVRHGTTIRTGIKRFLKV